MKKIQCRLCHGYFSDEEMSDEHYPARSVGNDDIIKLNFSKWIYDPKHNRNINLKLEELVEELNALRETSPLHMRG